MKTLEGMTEKELRTLTTSVCKGIKAKLPKGSGFAVIFWTFSEGPGRGQYGSNADRADMVNALREVAHRLETRQDTPRV